MLIEFEETPYNI